MKNKFLTSIIAVAVMVTMLGSVAFAADAVTGDKNILKPDGYQDGIAIHTILAFAADTADATVAEAKANPESIIALEQSTTELSAIKIIPERFAGAKYIIVFYSGDAADGATKTVIPISGNPVNVTIEIKDLIGATEYPEVVSEIEYEDAEKLYTNLIAATYTFSLENVFAWGNVGAEFTQTKNGGTAKNSIIKDNIDDLFEGDGNVEITFGFTGVPTDAGTFTALPFYQEYQQQQ